KRSYYPRIASLRDTQKVCNLIVCQKCPLYRGLEIKQWHKKGRRKRNGKQHLFSNFVFYAKTKFKIDLAGNLACGFLVRLQLRNSSGFSPNSPVFCLKKKTTKTICICKQT